MVNIDISNNVAIVTGASRGIGKAIALKLAQAGADIAIIYEKNIKLANETKREIELIGRKCIAIQCNVSNENEVENAVNQVVDNFSKIDILVNNTGINKDNLIIRLNEDDWNSVIDVNLKGAFFMTKHMLKYMLKEKYGRIVNISSLVGITGNPGQCNYVSSKAGLIGFTKVVAQEYSSRNITANAIAPGFIKTDMTDKLSEEKRKSYIDRILLRRIGEPEDIANAVLFLVSDLGSYITGQVLVIDGGLSIK